MREMSLRDIQLFSLEIMKDVHLFCVKNDLRYSLIGGTLIGAMRNNGFIPWDDDLDICMPRPDYERFCRSYKSEKYRLISPEDKESMITYARVCDMELTYRDASFSPWATIDTGVWIDIFPMDGASDNYYKYRLDAFWISFFYKLLTNCRSSHELYNNNMSLKYKSRLFLCKMFFLPKLKTFNLFVTKLLQRIVLRLTAKYEFGETGHWTKLSCPLKLRTEYHIMSGFNSYSPKLFEGEELLIFDGYHVYLTDNFGDYMTPPPPDKRIQGHGQFACYWK